MRQGSKRSLQQEDETKKKESPIAVNSLFYFLQTQRRRFTHPCFFMFPCRKPRRGGSPWLLDSGHV